MEEERELLSLREAARRLGISGRQLKKLVKQHEISFFQAVDAGWYKFRPEWIEEYISRHTTEASK